MKQAHLAALLHVLTFVIVLGISAFAEPRLPIPRSIAKPAGMFIFLLGMIGFTWVLAHLKQSFLGTVDPVSDSLVTTGPYRWLRHPLYLTMVVSALGLALALRSPWGLIGVFLLFAPAGAYRAMLEDKALAQQFGPQWSQYADRTFFMFPPLW